MNARFKALCQRLRVAEGEPVIAVPVSTPSEEEAVRSAGALPVFDKPSRGLCDGVIAVDAKDPRFDVEGVRKANPDVFIMDTGTPRCATNAGELTTLGVDGISVGSLGYGDNGGTPGDRALIYNLKNAVAVVSGGLNALRALGFFDNLGYSSVVVLVGRGVIEHRNGIVAGIDSIRQAARCRQSDGRVFCFAKDNGAFANAFESFPDDADALYPGWRQHLQIGSEK